MPLNTGPDWSDTPKLCVLFGDNEWPLVGPDGIYPAISNILYSLMWDRQRAQAASGGPSLPHLQAGLTSGPQVLPCMFRRCRLLSFHPFPALISPVLMTFIRPIIDHLFLIGIIPAPI